MTLVVGLGNPGPKYQGTRHNIGFEVVEQLAHQAGAPKFRAEHEGATTSFELEGELVRLLKPLTYMNRSGVSVRAASRFYRVAPSDILVVHDELDLSFGQVRLKLGGGNAGHNGLRSLTDELGSLEFGRLRMGIGRPPADFSGTVADYVLRAFAPEELMLLPDVISKGTEALKLAVRLGLAQAMNQVNRRAKEEASKPTS